MARKPAPKEHKLKVVKRYYELRIQGICRKPAAVEAGASIPTIGKWEKELTEAGVEIWPK